jgi:serine/threonine protein kinase
MDPGEPCPQCRTPLPSGTLSGLCPACLLDHATGSDPGVASANARKITPPPINLVAGMFPRLVIESVVGSGGMGAVYKAHQPALERHVALKLLPPDPDGTSGFSERFTREARALARLTHPHIVVVHEFGHVDLPISDPRRPSDVPAGQWHFILMEFVDGANLRQLERAGTLTPRDALRIIPQICDALQYAHDEGVVHRDIKPENVLLDRRGRVKIADFGLARILGRDPDSDRLTRDGQVMGTPHYMAPEQVSRPLWVDHRADLYSLGVVFYEMLTGALPLGKFEPPSRRADVDARFDDVVLRALENDPERRYQQASEIRERVESIGNPDPSAARPPNPIHTPSTDGTGAPASPDKNKDTFRMGRIWAAILGLGLVLLGVSVLSEIFKASLAQHRERSAQLREAQTVEAANNGPFEFYTVNRTFRELGSVNLPDAPESIGPWMAVSLASGIDPATVANRALLEAQAPPGSITFSPLPDLEDRILSQPVFSVIRSRDDLACVVWEDRTKSQAVVRLTVLTRDAGLWKMALSPEIGFPNQIDARKWFFQNARRFREEVGGLRRRMANLTTPPRASPTLKPIPRVPSP